MAVLTLNHQLWRCVNLQQGFHYTIWTHYLLSFLYFCTTEIGIQWWFGLNQNFGGEWSRFYGWKWWYANGMIIRDWSFFFLVGSCMFAQAAHLAASNGMISVLDYLLAQASIVLFWRIGGDSITCAENYGRWPDKLLYSCLCWNDRKSFRSIKLTKWEVHHLRY